MDIFRTHVLILAFTLVAATSGCASVGWDACICEGGALPATHFINGQLIAELARDDQ